jgi:hypothetical protein
VLTPQPHLPEAEPCRARRIRLRSVDPSSEPFTYSTIVSFDVAADGSLTPHFPPDSPAHTMAEFARYRTEAEVRDVYTSYSSFVFWDHEGDPDPADDDQPDESEEGA